MRMLSILEDDMFRTLERNDGNFIFDRFPNFQIKNNGNNVNHVDNHD